MGKSEDQLKKRTKEAAKSPISLFWLGKNTGSTHALSHVSDACDCALALTLTLL